MHAMTGVASTNVNTRIDWPKYLRIISDDASGAQIAATTGIPASTISRWLSGEFDPKPRQVVQVARGYGVSPLQALIAAGYLDPDEVDLAAITPRRLQLQEFTELEIAEEMVRRIAEGESVILESPLDGNHPAMRNVSPIRKDAKSPSSAKPFEWTEAFENPTKKAALTDPEMNTDESYD